MSARKIAAVALSGVLLAGATGAAIAAVSKGDRDKTEQAILDDAAKRLDVAPQKLRDALTAAQDAQLDKAVADGDLTRKQADAMNEHRKESGRVLGGPCGPGKPHVFGERVGPGFGPKLHARHGVLIDFAKALGITQAQLHEQFEDGKSVADIAKAQGTSLDDVRAAVKSDVKARAAKAVKAGHLTQSQADKMLDHLDEVIENFDEAPRFRKRLHRDGPPDLRPGSFVPGPRRGARLGACRGCHLLIA